MDVSQVQKLFQTHNRSRIERLIELAPNKKQAFFQLLPLLFHTNEPEMPGFTLGAPQGLVEYQPTKRTLDAAKTLQRSFNFKQHAFLEYPLQGLYLINDYGSVYYPENPEYDLLLIHAANLSEDEIKHLNDKLDRIVKWALTFDIRLNTQLVNRAMTLTQPLDSHYLDRLYCNGLIFGGCAPLWWFIHLGADEPENYQAAIQKLNSEHNFSIATIDFGPLGKRSAKALFQQGYQESINAMNKGLPGFLGLLYERIVIEHFDDAPWLASAYKHAVYQNQKDTFFCDPNILKTYYLSNKLPTSILGLVRCSLYLLCEEKLSFDIKNAPYPWRRASLKAFPKLWDWSDYNIKAIDHRYEARFRERLKEFKQTRLLTEKLNNLLATFSQQHKLQTNTQQQELNSLHRELFASSPAMIEILPNKLLPEEGEEFLFLERDSTESKWYLFEQSNTPDRSIDPLYSDHSLLRTLAWAVCNKVLTKTSRIRVTDKTREVSTSLCLPLAESLLKSPIAQINYASNEQTETLDSWQLFANIEVTPKEAFKRQDLNFSLRQQDPFNYSFQRTNLILTLEGLALNSHGQCHYFKYDGPYAVVEMLSTLIRWTPTVDLLDKIDTWCATPNLSTKISQRLTRTCKQLLTHYFNHPDNGTYILELSNRLYRIQWHEAGSDYIVATKKQTLDDLLADKKPLFAATKIDSLVDGDDKYSLLLEHQAENTISLFFYKEAQQITVYILDEVASIYSYSFTKLRQQTIASNLRQFFSNSLKSEPEVQLHFFNMEYHNAEWSLSEFIIFEEEYKTSYLPIKIELDNPIAPVQCIIHCGATEFKGSIKNPALFKKVRELVMNLRKGVSSYPFYITELSFLKQQDNTSRQYVSHKQKLEILLNNH